MSSWYVRGKSLFLTGDIDWINDTILASLVDLSVYTPDYFNDIYLSAIPAGAIVGKVPLSGKAVYVPTSGDVEIFATAHNLVVPAIDTLQPISAVVLSKTMQNPSSSPLIILIDQGTFPVTPEGEPITVRWPLGRVFSQ